MSNSMFNARHFQSPEAAREYLEALRWGSERICPHCGSVNESSVRRGGSTKNTVLTLVERGGSARSFQIDDARVATVLPIIRENVERETVLPSL
jgi:hypothetical protein